MMPQLSNWQRTSSCLLFLLGVFGSTQIYLMGCIGISELVVFIVAPWIFLKDYKRLQNDGFMPFLSLIILNMIGGTIISLWNDVWFLAVVKSLSALYSMFALTVVFHRLLRNNFYGIRWFLLGSVLSDFIKLFAFNPKVTTTSSSVETIDTENDNYEFTAWSFWGGRLFGVMRAVVGGWFYHVPIWAVYVLLLLYALSLIQVTVSGRSSIALCLAGLVLVTIAGKTNKGLKKLRKSMFKLSLAMLLLMVGLKAGYGKLASSGALGDRALWKYEFQTRKGAGFLDYLRSGRAEFFIGLSAILDKPIFGFGAVPVDDKGYVLSYIAKHGTYEDYQAIIEHKSYTYADGINLIPSHSHIIGFWISNGISGLFLWLYVLGLFWNYYRKWLPAVPQLYPFIVYSTPVVVWDIFFSPLTNRFVIPLIVTCILFAKAASRGVRVSDSCDMGLIDGFRR